MISAKDAAQFAVKYYQEVSNDYNSVGIAEIEQSKDGQLWLITLAHKISSGSPFAGFEDKIGYKVFEINSENGEVISMKIKKI